ncbi:MAG: glycosyltransferase family 2 protein, partial [Nocardioides sp.]
VGYGAEDTDFAQRARRAGATMWWVGGALAHHQWHPVSDPPVEHLDDVVRNANLFHRRWGWFPMTGWLEAFARRGLADYDGESWVVLDAARDG